MSPEGWRAAWYLLLAALSPSLPGHRHGPGWKLEAAMMQVPRSSSAAAAETRARVGCLHPRAPCHRIIPVQPPGGDVVWLEVDACTSGFR